MSGVVTFLLVKNDNATARYSETRVRGGTGPQNLPDNGELMRSAGSDDCTWNFNQVNEGNSQFLRNLILRTSV